MCDKVYVVGHCSVAGGGCGASDALGYRPWDAATLELHGLAGGNPKFVHGLADAGKTAKSFIDYFIESAKQITIEITLKDGRKTKAVIDL